MREVRGLIASPLGFLIGVSLGALGSGGSILAVPVLVYVAGQEPSAATTTSLFVVGVAALFGMVDHLRAGRVRVGVGVVVGLTGIGGSLVGSAINRSLDGDVLLLGFGALVIVAAWRMLTGCPSCTRVGEEQAVALTSGAPTDAGGVAVRTWRQVDASTVARVAAAGTLVGFLTGLFGVGGGFVIVPALTLLLGFTLPQAVGTSLLVVAINTVTALSVRVGTTGVEWGIAIPFTVSAIAGVVFGNRLAGRVDAKVLLRWFAGMLIVLAVYIIGSATVALVSQ